MSTGRALLALAERHIGERYVLGAFAPKDNPGWRGPWDCAELASWLVYQTSGRLYGCGSNAGPASKADAFTGFWARDAHTLGRLIPAPEAARTPGAFLLRTPPPGPGAIGHIAVSDGLGGTVEAMGTEYGVRRGKVAGRVWNFGVAVPWMTFEANRPPVDLGKPDPVLNLGDHGNRVRLLQRDLAAAGYDPGTIDGIFGDHTLAAVTAFQRAHGLVVDGLVGPATMEALKRAIA